MLAEPPDFEMACGDKKSQNRALRTFEENTVPVPTEAEWGNYQADPDQTYAHKLFAGRTNQEMLPHLRRNVIERTDNLRWMPVAPFRY